MVRVSGAVQFESKLVIDGDYLTVASKTAPGDGYTNLEEFLHSLTEAGHVQ